MLRKNFKVLLFLNPNSKLNSVWHTLICSEFIAGRIKDVQQRRVLDETARKRRQRKALEALEEDNFQEDPHADLKMNKRAPKFEESVEACTTLTFYLSHNFSFPRGIKTSLSKLML